MWARPRARLCAGWTIAALAVVAVVGCHRPPARLDLRRDADARTPKTVDPAELAEVERVREPPLPIQHALDLVPVGALGVAHVPNYRELLIRLGRDRFVGRQPDRYDEVARELIDELGIDPLDPDQLPRIGIDPDGPLGFALLDLRSEAFMLYFRLRDRDALEAFVRRRLDPVGIEREELGSARVLRLPGHDDVRLLLRPDFGALVFVDRPQRAPRDFVAALAEGDARRSVHHDPRFASVFAELESDAQLVGLVDPMAILDATTRLEDARLAPQMPPPPAGASQAELDAWEAQRQDMERFAREDRERRAQERAALEGLVGEVTALAGSVVLAPGELRMRGVAALPERSHWRALLASGEQPAVLAVLPEKPLLILGGSLRTDAALRLLERVAAVEGTDPQRLRDEMARELSVGIDELAGALEGDFGFAITQASVPKQADKAALSRSYGVVGVAGLRDPGAASRLLALVGNEPKAGLRREQKLDAYAIELDGRTAHLAIVGRHLVVATDPAVLGQLRRQKPGALERHVPDARLREHLERPGVLSGYLDALVPVLGDLYLPYPLEATDPVSVHPQLSAEDLARVPKSKAYRVKLREYEKTLSQLRKADAKRATRQLARAVEVGRLVGRLAFDARATELGYVARASWALGVDDVASLVDALAREPEDESDADHEQRRRLEQRRWRLEDELRELRMREIEAWLRARSSD